MFTVTISHPDGRTATVTAKAWASSFKAEGWTVASSDIPPPPAPKPTAEMVALLRDDLVIASAGHAAPKAARPRQSTGHPTDPIKPEPPRARNVTRR